jgi:hypothetical protein
VPGDEKLMGFSPVAAKGRRAAGVATRRPSKQRREPKGCVGGGAKQPVALALGLRMGGSAFHAILRCRTLATDLL